MIQFDHVVKTFPGATTPAVRNFTLDIPARSTTVLVGSSGSGKTTLLRMINRMVEPTEGRVLIDGEDLAGVDPVKLRRSIGYVMQNSGLLPHRTVADNIATVPRLNGVPRKQARERAGELLELLGLDGSLAKRYPSELSGGQAQRVGVARALADDPNILLMDEPFGAIDPVVRRDLQEQILDLQEKISKTIVLVTHDIDEAFLLGDNIVLLEMGARIAQAGTAEDFVTDPASDFVASFVGTQDRELTLRERDGTTVAVDRHGRVKGVVR
ncbi:ABC transporter ATP-binding protein [Corynebacterium sp. TAE3-ERU16]|uniref:ABC transporter ATP-binding protein n=1 Tax=Corynebacterium sp. TAE3-ERU16 TaxID=2849493 RepID=UPI001C4853B6|nr:ATP-binding cassette domain-containing protein [Corynebacterium sp. TAE3-ERU16]MBV7293715.1 ATP-binding cassette domain-containing protein [Corynebacterium sp. TAE3-ERU16]